MKQRIFFLLIFSLLLLSSISKSQNIADTYIKAKKLYNDSLYADAAECFDRVAFFDTPSATKDSALMFEAQCYYNLHDYKKALQLYNNLCRPSKKNVRDVAFWEVIKCQFELRQFDNALTTLSICDIKLDSAAQRKFLFYKCVAQLACNYYEDAQENILLYIGDSTNPVNDSIKLLIKKLIKLYNSNPAKVKYLSMLLPGSGQIINGKFSDGMNSLLLNAALIAVTVETSIAYTVVDGVLSVAPWWFRYYQGGIRNAELQAVHKKEKKRNAIIQKIIVLLDNNK